jgi:hypothetical protein
MTSGHVKPAEGFTGSTALMLEMGGPSKSTPLRVPVIIRNLSMGGVTLAVTNPWTVADWDQYQGDNCLLQVEDPGSQQVVSINAKIAWSKFGGHGQPPLSLGLHLVKPPAEALRQLSDLLPHTPQDMKRLWDRYDQVRQVPERSNLAHHCYISGLVLLVGGLALQFSGSAPFKLWGWVLWLLGSMGVAVKIIMPLWQKRTASDQFGKTL